MPATTPSTAASGNAAPGCYHCGLPVPPGLDLRVAVDGAPRPMCCPGCQAVAEAIVEGGMADYYRLRTEPARRGEPLVPAFLREAEVYDLPELQAGFVRDARDGREADLILEGIECAACAWLNERRLNAVPGVLAAEVNYSTHRARVCWDPERVRLSQILAAVRAIGYRAHPYDAARQEGLLQAEQRARVRRLGLAGLLGMQVMMIAVALYLGDWLGMDDSFRRLFRWVSLGLAAPVLAYCAQPFLAGAWRDVANRRVGMDVPVALGLCLAFAGSAHATLVGGGEVYFDSVVMFTFFLLLARHLEFAARRRNLRITETLVHQLPETAVRLREDGTEEAVPAAALAAGDRVLVRPGDTAPADGVVASGRTTMDEALLTGESDPRPKGAGDPVLAGSVNFESPVVVTVRDTGAATVRSRILALVERTRAERPRSALLADRVAGWFVGAVLALAAVVGAGWWAAGSERWLAVTVSVLVVTCPCALSLATPVALTNAIGALARLGLVATTGRAVEAMARATRVVFDKTGTLTRGRLELVEARPLDGGDPGRWLRAAAALERGSEHPVARAFAAAVDTPALPAAEGLRNTPGSGVSGEIDGRYHALGSAVFAAAACGGPTPAALPPAEAGDTAVFLADREAVRCGFLLRDTLRADAPALAASLRAMGLGLSLYSGDRRTAAAAVAEALGVDDVAAELAPEAKVERVRELRAHGERVMMVGDGLNDAPVLASADVSVAMAAGARAAQASADVILLGERLAPLGAGLLLARRTRRVVVQNLAWAAGYNVLALPAAAAGLIPPWLAALGMSLSSLVVVGNSLRLLRPPRGS